MRRSIGQRDILYFRVALQGTVVVNMRRIERSGG